MKGFRVSHLIHCIMKRLYESRHDGLRDVADSKTDDLLIRICGSIGIHLFCDGRKQIASRQF